MPIHFYFLPLSCLALISFLVILSSHRRFRILLRHRFIETGSLADTVFATLKTVIASIEALSAQFKDQRHIFFLLIDIFLALAKVMSNSFHCKGKNIPHSKNVLYHFLKMFHCDLPIFF